MERVPRQQRLPVGNARAQIRLARDGHHPQGSPVGLAEMADGSVLVKTAFVTFSNTCTAFGP